jgi:hypothetical protein
MTYEARCILQRLKTMYDAKRIVSKADILELAHDIADGSVARNVTVSSHLKVAR